MLRRWAPVVATLVVVAAVAYAGVRLWPESDPNSSVSTPAEASGPDAAHPDSPTGAATATSTTKPATPKSTAWASTTTTVPSVPAIDRPLSLLTTIRGAISPKSVDASGTGVVFAQNMMYQHTVTAYDADGSLLATIPDSVDLTVLGSPGHPGVSKGAPVEGAVSADGKSYYVSNYSMYGANFGPEGSDNCRSAAGLSNSYLYRINVATLKVEAVAEVGAVPKYVTVTPNGKYVLATNWCSYDLSIVDRATFKEIKRVPLGAFPRGIAVDPGSNVAYIAMMGSTGIARVDLNTFAVTFWYGIGTSPRHLVLDKAGKYLYATLNGSNQVVKIDTANGSVVGRVNTGNQPRSMAMSSDGTALYVVNYQSNTMTKVRASDLAIGQSIPTPGHPIGIAYEPTKHRLWVACYSGEILVFNA